MVFSDLLDDPEPVLQGLHHLRHRGHEIILFHILDEAEVHFPFDGVIEFEDMEEKNRLTLDARTMCRDYVQAIAEFQEELWRRSVARRAWIMCQWIRVSGSTRR